jgi:hypothetical protein
VSRESEETLADLVAEWTEAQSEEKSYPIFSERLRTALRVAYSLILNAARHDLTLENPSGDRP